MTVTDADEFLHAPPSAASLTWQENLFFICWDTRTATGLLCHIQRAPGAGLQEAQLAVMIAGELASTTVAGPYVHNTMLPGLLAQPVDPFRRWHLQIDAAATVGLGPLGLVALDRAGDTRVAIDVVLESVLPVADFAEGLSAIVAVMQADPNGSQMGEQQHYEQGGTWRGRVQIGDHEVETSGLFVRDHSWGIRNEQHGFEAFWTASCLDGGRLFCNAIGVPRDGRTLGIGTMVDERGATFTSDVGTSFSPAAGIGSYDTTAVSFGAPIGRTLTAMTQLHVPIYLPHSGPRRYDNNAISTVRIGEAEGFGVMEWASVLTEHEVEVVESHALAG